MEEYDYTEEQAYAAYDESWDETYPETPLGISAARIVKECDPIAYRVGFSDYVDGLIQDGYTVEGY